MPNKNGFGLRDIPSEMNILHAKMTENDIGSWSEIGKLIGISGAYARMVALKIRPLILELATRWLRDVEFTTIHQSALE